MILNMISGNGGTPVVGTPTLDIKGDHVTAQRTSASVLSFSGLNVSDGETLVGVYINYSGTESTNQKDLNNLYLLQDGDSWKIMWATVVNGASAITSTALFSFVPSGNDGGTITMNNYSEFLTGDYYVFPIVATIS